MNNSVMKCCICNNKNTGEFITIEDKKYHLICIKNLQTNWNELKKCIKDEIERTENLIKEDCNIIQINNIRKMLNEDRECWLYKMQSLEEGGNNE